MYIAIGHVISSLVGYHLLLVDFAALINVTNSYFYYLKLQCQGRRFYSSGTELQNLSQSIVYSYSYRGLVGFIWMRLQPEWMWRIKIVPDDFFELGVLTKLQARHT